MTIDKHADVSVALALRLEGAAIMADVTTEELLTKMLDKKVKKIRRNRETETLREVIKERHAEGLTDTAIAEELGVTQQTISRHRAGLGLKSNFRGRPRKT